MTIDKEKFLDDLQMVKSGLSNKELFEQSNCFVFKDGYVFTFNDEVACRKKTELTLEGAVPAAPLLSILEMLDSDKTLEVSENDNGELEFRGKRKKFAIARDAEVLLPIEKVTEEIVKTWARLPDNFGDVVAKIKDCVGTNEADMFSMTCIHLHPKYIEASDNRQLIRWHISLGNKTPLLVRGTAIGHIVGLGMSKISSTPSWIHFKNAAGLIFSVRKFVEEYPDMEHVLKVDGSKIKLPKGVVKASNRATVMASELTSGIDPTVTVNLRPPKPGEKQGAIMIEGRGLIGWYQEIKDCAYRGPKLSFVVTPGLLEHITNNYNEATISERKLKATGGGEGKSTWEYVTVLGKPRKAEPLTAK